MKTIYLDSDYICHLTPSEDRTLYETSYFDGMCDNYILGYRLVPEGETWTREDGHVFHGFMVCPAAPLNELILQQNQYETDLENMLPLEDVADLIEALYDSDMEVING